MTRDSIKRGMTQAAKAARAFARGKCLDAGGLIDRAWVEYGSARAQGASKASLMRLRRAIEATDQSFERRCVRKRPTERR